MQKIELNKWETIVHQVKEARSFVQKLGPAGYYYLSICNDLLGRYDSGDRSDDLYAEMARLN